MADTETPTPGVVAVDHDGWETESFGQELPSPESIIQDLNDGAPVDTDTPATPQDTPAAQQPSEQDRAAAAGTETETETTPDTPTATTRSPDGRFKKKVSASERIAVQQAQIHAKTREEKEIDRRLEAKRRELAAETRPAPKPGDAPKPGELDKPTAPTGYPDWDEYREQDKSWKQYQADVAAWTEARAREIAREERQTERQTQEQERQTQLRQQFDTEVTQQHTQRVAKAREAHADYADVVGNLAHIEQTPFLADVVKLSDHPTEHGGEILYWFGQNPEICEMIAQLPMTNSMMTAVRKSSSPIAMLEYLGTHPAEVVSISRQDPHAALWQLAQIDRSLTAQGGGAKTGSPTPASISNAKPPIGHLSGSRAVATSRPDDELDDDPNENMESYIKRKNAADRARGEG